MSTPTAPAEEPGRARPTSARRRRCSASPPARARQIGLILVGLIVVFSLLEFESFFAVANARNIATDAAVLLVLAVGATYVIITAGIDLSVGAVLVFSGVVAAKVDERAAAARASGVILVGLVAVARVRARVGAVQRLPDRQGEDPGVHRHARLARAWRSAPPT